MTGITCRERASDNTHLKEKMRVLGGKLTYTLTYHRIGAWNDINFKIILKPAQTGAIKIKLNLIASTRAG